MRKTKVIFEESSVPNIKLQLPLSAAIAARLSVGIISTALTTSGEDPKDAQCALIAGGYLPQIQNRCSFSK